ncbi:MAG: HNH endonuclease signature motif containing protein [Candidatus Nanopelagicales bacterium]
MSVVPSVVPPALPLVAAVAGVEADLDRLLGSAAVADAGDLDLADAAEALARVRAKLAAVDAAVVRRFTASGIWAGDGSRNAKAWLRTHTRAGHGEVAARARVADLCARHRHLAARLADGTVSTEHLRAVADAHAWVPALSSALDAAEPAIADYAACHTPQELRRFLSALLIRVDAAAVDDADAHRLHERAGLDVATLMDGWVQVAATLPPDIGATFLACLQSAGLAVRRADGATPADHQTDRGPGSTGSASASTASASTGAASDGAASTGADGQVCDRRPRRIRNLDALARLLAAAEASLGPSRLPDVRGSRPVVQITVTPAELARLAEHADPADAADAADALQLALDDRPTAALAGANGAVTVPLGPAGARRIACDAAIRRLVVDPGGAVLDVGRTTRVISPAQRAAVTHRDTGCRWPGCDCPIDEIHHIVHWAHGGPTDLANLVGLCWWHHHEVHERRWRITGHPDHRLEFHPPDGVGRALTPAA